MGLSQGAKFRAAVEKNTPLQIVGAINPYCAMMAKIWGIKPFTYLVVVWPMLLMDYRISVLPPLTMF